MQKGPKYNMFGETIFRKIFGSRNQRILKRLERTVEQVNTWETECHKWSDEVLKDKTADFKNRLTQGETLDDLLPEAFAVVREAGRRVFNMRHFDVQLLGGMVLHQGRIAEMHTGEGKTLMATLAAYLNALTGKGVHIVTINDYLAKRDAEWMGQLYRFLGLSVGVIVHGLTNEQKKAAYGADITYGTNNEFGFDYLRDNMAFTLEERVQRPLHYAIVDEVDSILIDEARTPLIISGPAEDSSALYQKMDTLSRHLIKQDAPEGPGDFAVDEKQKQILLTEEGHTHAEALMVEAGMLEADQSLYDAANILLLHHLHAALRANTLFQKDVDYIVHQDQIVIVDEHTGRTMQGRRWSEGLHQAIEAKEKVRILPENQTLASITFQNYFRLYEKISGMTGTADTEAYEFQQIYGLEVVVIPSNKVNCRQDLSDLVYLSQDAKFKAIIEDVQDCLSRKQPVLVGTASIETSEYLSDLMKQKAIPHRVLNAKFHEQEAEIVAEAGRPGTVTIATNMAGRGTDIVLGGSLESEWLKWSSDTPVEEKERIQKAWQERHDAVVAVGGLHVIGSERHESRRIDNQLRGRCGRQGDPGSTRFYLSIDDNLMRIFSSPNLKSMMLRLGLEADQAIESRMVTRAIEGAQRKVEARNFDIRKQLLQYDDVANEQRKVIYEQRTELMQAHSVSEIVAALFQDVISDLVQSHMPVYTIKEEWQLDELQKCLQEDFQLEIDVHGAVDGVEFFDQSNFIHEVQDKIYKAYLNKEPPVESEIRNALERSLLLQVLDTEWKEHLVAMDHLRQGIHLRGYAQKDPKQEYKREAFTLFEAMLERFKVRVVSTLSSLEWRAVPAAPQAEPEFSEENTDPVLDQTFMKRLQARRQGLDESRIPPLPANPPAKMGRNELCYCGSGKKYKHCCGKLETTES